MSDPDKYHLPKSLELVVVAAAWIFWTAAACWILGFLARNAWSLIRWGWEIAG